jgi:hypothetical protein
MPPNLPNLPNLPTGLMGHVRRTTALHLESGNWHL